MGDNHSYKASGSLPVYVWCNIDLTLTDYRVFWTVHSFTRTDRECWLSNEGIAEKWGLTTRGVQKSIKKLCDLEYIVREEKGDRRYLKTNSLAEDKYQHLVDKFYDERGRTGVRPPTNSSSPPPRTPVRPYLNNRSLKNDSLSKERFGSHDPNSLFSEYSAKAKDLFVHWNNHELRKTIPKDFKTFHLAMKNIEMALETVKGDMDLIAEAIDDYCDLINSGETILNKTIETHYVALADFFGWDRYVREKMRPNNPAYKIDSWFREAVKGFDYLMDTYGKNIVEDTYPNITEEILDTWENSVYCVGKASIKDINNFRICSAKMVKWFRDEDNKEDYSYDNLYVRSPIMAVKKYLFPALKHSLKGNDPREVSSGWLATDKMFSHRLHLYFVKLGMYHGGNGSGISYGGNEE